MFFHIACLETLQVQDVEAQNELLTDAEGPGRGVFFQESIHWIQRRDWRGPESPVASLSPRW